MKRRLHTPRAIPTIPTASMADIAFLLIIFFMLTTTFSPDRTNVDLPSSLTRDQVVQEPAIVAVQADGQINFSDGERNSEPITGIRELTQLAQEVMSVAPQLEFVIKADETVRYEVIDDVLDALRKAGVQNIGLLTNQKMVRARSN